jgi:KUP system potassium uptake protein
MEKVPSWRLCDIIGGGALFLVMYDWFKARKIKNRYVSLYDLSHYIPKIQQLSNDRAVSKYATHLLFI